MLRIPRLQILCEKFINAISYLEINNNRIIKNNIIMNNNKNANNSNNKSSNNDKTNNNSDNKNDNENGNENEMENSNNKSNSNENKLFTDSVKYSYMSNSLYGEEEEDYGSNSEIIPSTLAR